jgi:hypothetical protein
MRVQIAFSGQDQPVAEVEVDPERVSPFASTSLLPSTQVVAMNADEVGAKMGVYPNPIGFESV